MSHTHNFYFVFAAFEEKEKAARMNNYKNGRRTLRIENNLENVDEHRASRMRMNQGSKCLTIISSTVLGMNPMVEAHIINRGRRTSSSQKKLPKDRSVSH